MCSAAIRLAVVDEPDPDQEVVFDQRPRRRRPPGWTLAGGEEEEEEESGSGAGQRPQAAPPRSKAARSAHGDVAFSSPLVRPPLRPWGRTLRFWFQGSRGLGGGGMCLVCLYHLT